MTARHAKRAGAAVVVVGFVLGGAWLEENTPPHPRAEAFLLREQSTATQVAQNSEGS